MIPVRSAYGALLLVAIAAGTISDQPEKRQPVTLGGYRVLAVDFHVHGAPLSASTLAPWDLVLEARRQGLDAIAITGHNQTLEGKAGHWFSGWLGGPAVLTGEEIHAPHYHLIAVGIRDSISWRLSAPEAIDAVHGQGGIAIAAHPVADYWPAWTPEAMRKLDGAEVLQPVAYSNEAARAQLEQFYRRGRVAAIGSSDYHGTGPLSLCRTYVFARENSEQSILEAIRLGHTVVFDRGRTYGDPALIQLAQANRQSIEPRTPSAISAFLAILSRTCGALGIIAIVLFGFREPGSAA